MSREWKPGDVVAGNWSDSGKPFHGVIDIGGGVWIEGKGPYFWNSDDLRPLVAIDPDDRKQVETLRNLLWDAYTEQTGGGVVTSEGQGKVLAGNALQAALRSLVAPPKPDEPLKVGAAVLDEADTVWVRVENGIGGEPAWSSTHSHDGMWRDIAAVKILSDGVQS